jgi:CheY-like chemotaxis protein
MKSNSNLSIIFVDDEENAVKYFVKIFEKNFNIIGTTKSSEVLKIIDDNPSQIAAVVSDQKMPDINGTFLLSEIKKKNPNIIRILTTAYASLEDNIIAINESNVFAYLTKPWDIAQISEILQRAIEKFQEQQNYLNLSGSIAHEMRNPLNSVRQTTNFIKEKLSVANLNEKFCCDNDDEKITPLNKKDFQEIIESLDMAAISAKRGNDLIDIILDNIKQKPLNASNFKDCQIAEILKSAIDQYSFNPQEKERVIVDIASKNNFSVNCNDLLFSYVVFNLLKNSLYYSKSHPNLVIKIFAKIGDDNFNRIYFCDNGPGISSKKITNLFDSFLDSQKQGGTGLGLPFCKKTMEAFGGTISCNSKEGEFCEFILAFPKIFQELPSHSNLILLVGEHESDFLELKNLLEKNLESTQCNFAKNVDECLKILQQKNHELILCHEKNNQISPNLILQKIHNFTKTIPVLTLSEANKAEGFNDFLSAKSDEKQLLKKISKWSMIKLKNRLIEAEEAKQILKNKNILLVDDEKLNLILTQKFLEKFGSKISTATDGESALELVQKNNYDAILLDISMPILGGIETAKKIRQFQKQNNLSPNILIAFTGESSRDKINQILSAGFDDYFTKGDDYQLLLETVSVSLN